MPIVESRLGRGAQAGGRFGVLPFRISLLPCLERRFQSVGAAAGRPLSGACPYADVKGERAAGRGSGTLRFL